MHLLQPHNPFNETLTECKVKNALMKQPPFNTGDLVCNI